MGDPLENTPEPPRRAHIEYPCSWPYRLLGEDEAALRAAIAQVIEDREHTIEVGNSSRTGRYLSLHLQVIVQDEPDRNGLLRGLQLNADVKYVL